MIQLRTTIGFGSKDQGTHGVHGNPLKKDDTIEIKKKFGFNPEEFFAVPQETKDIYAEIGKKGAETEAAWNKLFEEYGTKYPEEAADIKRRLAGKLPDGWEKALPTFTPSDPAVASRKLSETLLAKLSVAIPELVSGSADLTPSNLTRWGNAVDFQPKANGLGDYSGRYIRYGVREHGMGAIMNGLAAYGANLVIPAAGESLVATYRTTLMSCCLQEPSSTSFPTPPEPSVSLLFRTSVSSGLPLTTRESFQYILSPARNVSLNRRSPLQSSIGLGEDGPTHQPVETVAHFRAMPNCNVSTPRICTWSHRRVFGHACRPSNFELTLHVSGLAPRRRKRDFGCLLHVTH